MANIVFEQALENFSRGLEGTAPNPEENENLVNDFILNMKIWDFNNVFFPPIFFNFY